MLNSSPLTIDLPKHTLDRVGNITLDRDIQLNSLALYTANWYLQCLQFKTHHEEQEDWWVQYLSRSAALEIAGIGKLECIPVTGDAATVTISSDLKDDRIGYLFVKLNESLTSAEIIGFMPKYSEVVRLDQLQSTDDLIDHLCDLEIGKLARVLVSLGKWSQGIFDGIWQEIENLPLAPVYRTLAYRNHRSFLTVKSTERGREIMLGDRSDSPSVIITVSYQQIDTDNYNLSLQVYPEESQKALPVGMKFSAIDDLGNGIGSVETTVGDISGEIVLEHGKPGEEFSIEIEFEGVKISESFKI
jgi:Protein of unknown function (DUF1822)